MSRSFPALLWNRKYLVKKNVFESKFFFNQTIILDMRLCLSSLSSIVHCCSIAVCNDLNVMWHKNKCEVQPYSADLERVCKKNALPTFAKYYAVYLLISSEFSKNVCQTWVTDRDWRYCKSKSNDWLQVPFRESNPKKKYNFFIGLARSNCLLKLYHFFCKIFLILE